ncbi:MAG: hypothetical protein ABW221_05505 [Vicinamibacteria bacterium]
MDNHLLAATRSALCLTVLFAGAAMPARAQQAGPIVAADMVVEDKAGKPVVDLKLADVEIVQDAERQRLTVLRPLGAPGQYEVQYVPASGRPNAMTVRVLRPGVRVRGLATPALQPLILRPPTALEAQLEGLLERKGDSNALGARVGLLHFERDARGQHQTVAVEVAAGALHSGEGQGAQGRLQVFARFKDSAGRVRERLAFDRPVESSATVRPQPGVRLAQGAPVFERLVWTGHLHLPTGAYSADVLVLDASSGRSSAHQLAFAVADPAPGPQISSVALLQPRDFLHMAEPVADDPLMVGAEPVMPALEADMPAGGDGKVRFFVSLYPDMKVLEPLKLQLELRRGEDLVGNVPLQLPPPAANGETRYVGQLATKTLRPAAYVMRLVVSQGTATSSSETTFTLVPAVP